MQHKTFVTALLLVIASSSWRIFTAGAPRNENNFDFKFEENLAEENDHGLDDRETRMENDNGNRDFDVADYSDQRDDDLFFLQDDDEVGKRKSGVDYSEWDTTNRFNLNDDVEGQKEEKEEEEAEKGMFKKLYEKLKNWVHKLGKRRKDE